MNSSDLQSVDKSHVVGGDVIVVILDVSKRFLVVFHQRMDLCTFSLFQLVQLSLTTKVVLGLKSTQLGLVLRLNLASVALVVLRQLGHELCVRLSHHVTRRYKPFTVYYRL